jgi:hypothetical protein
MHTSRLKYAQTRKKKKKESVTLYIKVVALGFFMGCPLRILFLLVRHCSLLSYGLLCTMGLQPAPEGSTALWSGRHPVRLSGKRKKIKRARLPGRYARRQGIKSTKNSHMSWKEAQENSKRTTDPIASNGLVLLTHTHAHVGMLALRVARNRVFSVEVLGLSLCLYLASR